MQNQDELITHQDRDVESITIHPAYADKRRLYNDIALLHLAEDFELKENLDTVCLPNFIEEQEKSFDTNDCYVMGWGKNAFGEEGTYQNTMIQFSLSLVEHDECEVKLRKTELRDNFILHDNFVCAGGEKDRDVCEGDGGGPLVCRDKNNKDDM